MDEKEVINILRQYSDKKTERVSFYLMLRFGHISTFLVWSKLEH